jgi:hypothetical protein
VSGGWCLISICHLPFAICHLNPKNIIQIYVGMGSGNFTDTRLYAVLCLCLVVFFDEAA